MASQQLSLYVFGDQTYNVQSHFKDLMSQRHNPLVESFLLKAYDAIRTEIYKLNDETRNTLPRFTSLDDLILQRQPGKRCIPLDMAMTCMYQLGIFISQADPWEFFPHNSRIIGLCTGALAATAVSCSRSNLDLIPKAVDVVVIAFRTGMLVTDAAQRIELSNSADQSWSIIVPGLAAIEVVQKFCDECTLPLTKKPYISAYAPNGITVSGPPSSLLQLTDSPNFQNLSYKSIPIYGPYHSPHLYSRDDVEDIIEGSVSCSASTDIDQYIPILSGTGTTLEGGSYKKLLKATVEQILLQPIVWPDIIGNLQILIQQADPIAFKVSPIASTADHLIYTALRQTSLRSLLPPNLASNVPQVPSNVDLSSPSKPKLAIIGMSGRYPSAKDNEAFWDLLYQGLDVHKPAPALHWDVRTHVDPTGERKNTSATPYGCWLDDPGEFDARFFNISPREAPQIDPAQRLALMTAYEAIEQAGIVPDATPSTRRDRVGVFYGVTSNDWMETNSAQNIDTYFIPGGNRAFIPGRINYCFKFSGPSFAVDTACSSSLAGIHLACNALWRGDIDTAIAGGTNVLTNPDFTAGLDRGHFLSRTGNCKTFDDSADGYCRGEGVGTIIIKRYEDAIADNDPIQALILGAYTNHSAESESITRPHAGAQCAIFNKILNQAAVDPYTVGYVEMHGTGTQAGDAAEMSSVLDTFAPSLEHAKKGRAINEALYLGSAKSNIGHGEAASGVTSLIKVLLMMQKNIIVPHSGIKTKINHRFPLDLKERNVNIAMKPTSWERDSDPAKPRRAFVNNFSAAGGNSALLIEDAPLKIHTLEEAVDPKSFPLIAISAKNGVSLQGNLKSLFLFLQQNPKVSLNKLSYTTTARRLHHQHRVMISGHHVSDLCSQIEGAIRDQVGMTRPKSTPKIVFTFTGQGAQYPGMGKELFERFILFRTEIRRLDQIGQSLGFPSMIPVIQSEEQDIGIFTPTAVQLASIGMQIALSKLWASWGIKPSSVVGHSLGEYAALNVAGVLSDTDTIYLVGKRADLLQKNCTQNTHCMLVVKGSEDEISSVMKNTKYETACINSPVETVLAGKEEQISKIKKLLTDAGLKSTLLKVPYAFHSSQIEPIMDELNKFATGVTFNTQKLPILCPLNGNVVNGTGTFGPEYLARHSREPVNMMKALLTAHSERIINEQTTMLEIGPHPAISGMIRAVLGAKITSLASLQRSRPALHTIGASLKSLYTTGADISWHNFQRDFKSSHEVIPLPAYSWDLKQYWLQYVNDWSLRKGDPPLTITAATNNLESTTIHRIVEESGDSEKAHIIVEANIAREDLSPLVQGHEVDGIPLCTPSVYADIALTLGKYLLQRYQPDQQENLVNVSDMTISKALILRNGAAEQLIQAHTDVDWSSNAATMKFVSFDSKRKLQEHSRCVVRFQDRSLLKTLQDNLPNVKQKMQALRDGIASGVTARYNRPMVYRAIRPLARFHDDYRAIDEIVLNSNTLEASSVLSYGGVKRGGDFSTHPAIIDSLTQSCGFAMNCNDTTDLDSEVYMNHGWGSFQIFEPLDFEKTYNTYTRMSEGVDKLWHGDVVVFDGETIVAHFGQIAIQGVPRRVLKVILSLESGTKTQKPQQQPSQMNAPTSKKISPTREITSFTTSNASKGLSIIADESGIALSDLTDTTMFSDVGIDSLLGLTISARFKEDLDIDLDFNALFFEYPTVADLKTFLGESGTNESDSSYPSSTAVSTPDKAGTLTPSSDVEGFSFKVDFQRALQIISEESGMAMEDLTDDTNFADSGVDSLLSLVIVSRLRDELELDIQHESLFLECPTVADLKKLLLPDITISPAPAPLAVAAEVPARLSPRRTEAEMAVLASRRKAVDYYVQNYVAEFFAPAAPSSTSSFPNANEKVVLVTGASGSLGSNLVYHIAQLADVKQVVCLNRKNKTEPYERQRKAMREKGIRFPDALKPKLLVLQTDSSEPMFGLPGDVYDSLVGSVTHLIHNAWPMSAKRPLVGFESQFQVMRNLIDFARDAQASRPASFKFSFQMVSSIGVVGNYGLGTEDGKIVVPENRVDIDSVLPNGYGEAKWGCERMLDETLHKYPGQFRTMVVRLGQIAGSETSGYWSPMEHFGFMIKSSQTLNALPDVDGTVYWTPVNQIAASLSDLVLSDRTPYPIYHIDNPVGQPWRETNVILADALKIPNLIPFQKWLQLVREAPQRNNPASILADFLESTYLRMSCGGLVLDTKNSVEHSKTLASVGPVSEGVVRKYIHIWKEIGFLC